LKSYELESFLKSFLIFFVLLEVLLALDLWYEYQSKQQQMEEKIRMEMKLCAYSAQCNKLHMDFVERSNHIEENMLYKANDLYSYFSVPTVKKYLIKVVYPAGRYQKDLAVLENKVLQKFLFYSLFAALVSLLFSIYALMPLRKALRLNEEFVKDILHDFNTPLSSMKINLKLFQKEIGENQKIARLENNIQTLLSLQHNLKTFLSGTQTQIESLDVADVVAGRIPYFKVLYPDIAYHVHMEPFHIKVNKDAFVRVIDNLLSNAGKYNKASGQVRIETDGSKLHIKDTGKGIKHPSKVFTRYYKEQERGIGIGLHIVKKLCDEMRILIKIESREGEGTTVILDLSKVAIASEAL
jgi:signal transduction histidine kinase